MGDVGKEVTVCGWVDSRRDHGGLIFIDLRDRYGITQIVIEPDQAAAFEIAQTLRSEFVIGATGKVSPRGEGMENPKHETGQVEVDATQIELFNNPDRYPIGVYVLPKHLDEKVARLQLKKLGAQLTELSDAQARYIGVAKEGPYKPESYRY